MHAMVRLGTWLAADVRLDPSSDMPGGELVQEIINWLGQLALWGSLASILCGAAVYGLSQQAGNFAGATKGKHLALAGVVGSALTGLAPFAINTIFEKAS